MIRPLLMAACALALACGGAFALARGYGAAAQLDRTLDPMVPALRPLSSQKTARKAAPPDTSGAPATADPETLQTSLSSRAFPVPDLSDTRARDPARPGAPALSDRPTRRPAQLALPKVPTALPQAEAPLVQAAPAPTAPGGAPASGPADVWAVGVYR
ncbi:MAG: hypothetical protein AAFY65_17905 [Pseudomonadota bacterium]